MDNDSKYLSARMTQLEATEQGALSKYLPWVREFNISLAIIVLIDYLFSMRAIYDYFSESVVFHVAFFTASLAANMAMLIWFMNKTDGEFGALLAGNGLKKTAMRDYIYSISISLMGIIVAMVFQFSSNALAFGVLILAIILCAASFLSNLKNTRSIHSLLLTFNTIEKRKRASSLELDEPSGSPKALPS